MSYPLIVEKVNTKFLKINVKWTNYHWKLKWMPFKSTVTHTIDFLTTPHQSCFFYISAGLAWSHGDVSMMYILPNRHFLLKFTASVIFEQIVKF